MASTTMRSPSTMSQTAPLAMARGEKETFANGANPHLTKRRPCAEPCSRRKFASKKPVGLDRTICRDDAPIEILPGLFIGSIHCAFNDVALQAAGITHIVNATGLPATFPKLFTYLTLGLRDKEYANLFSCIPLSNTFIRSVHTRANMQSNQDMDDITEPESGHKEFDGDNANVRRGFGGVLVHCSFGRSRSAALIVAYLMRAHGLCYQAAVDLVKSRRPVAAMNPSFQEQLQYYEKAGFDVHAAHQLFISARAQSLKNSNRIRAYRPAASTLHLHPAMQTLQLPRMLAMDLEFACRGCKILLFHAADVVVQEPSVNTTVRVQDTREEALRGVNHAECPQNSTTLLQSEVTWMGAQAQRKRAQTLGAVAFGLSAGERDVESLVLNDAHMLQEMLARTHLSLGQPLPWMPRNETSLVSEDNGLTFRIKCPGCSVALGSRRVQNNDIHQMQSSHACKIDLDAIVARESKKD